jgi:hypothetical protein
MPLKESGNNSTTALDAAIAGLNDNLSFLGKSLHVQTERIGRPSPHIETQVFLQGRVIASKKSAIPENLLDPNESDKVQELMKLQHFQMIQELSEKQKKRSEAGSLSKK